MNRKVRWLGMTLLGLTLLTVQSPSGAGGEDVKKKDDAEKAVSGFDRAITAYQLVELGRAEKRPRPEYFIAAAAILGDLASPKDPLLKVEKATLELEGGKEAPAPEAGKLKGYKVQADELLAEAEKLADGDAAVLGLLKAVRNRERGAVLGPQARQRVVPGKATDSVQIAFNANQPARIGIHQLGTNQVVAMSLVGPKGNILYRDRCIVGQANFTPLGQGVWTVRIYNPNDNAIVYRLFTN